MLKKSLILVLTTIGISNMSVAKEIVLTDFETNQKVDAWQEKVGDVTITKKTLHGGRQEGSELLTIQDPNGLNINLIPTRGLGILSVTKDNSDVKLGWDSPIDEIVNPQYINLDERSGLGWLDGFNEMLVRCGYEWTGHPSVVDGRLYTLHGRAQNIPVSKLIVSIDENNKNAITIKGLIKEKTFKFSNLETWVSLTYQPSTQEFTVNDALTNKGDYPQDYEIIYHSNYGAPILEKDAQFIAPVKEVSPFEEKAAKLIDSYQTYMGQTPGFDEVVYNVKLNADNNNKTKVLLVNKEQNKGVGMEFDVQQLPVFSLWKNMDQNNYGYVTGLEPGTNFAYPVYIEREQQRINQVKPGETVHFDLKYVLLDSKDSISKYSDEIKQIQGDKKTEIIEKPIAVKR